MKTLNVSISDVEYAKFGITNNVISFSDFDDLISKKMMKKNMDAALKSAEAAGLSSMTMEDITTEVQAVRAQCKKS